jgi:uncharacterized protein (TIGR02246 family)
MKKLLMILSLVFLLCFTISCQKAEEVAEEPVVDVEADVQAIKSLEDEAMKAFNEGDLERYLSLLTDDVVWMAHTQPTVFGKEAVKDWVKFDLFTYEIAITVEEVQVFGDIALVRDIWKGKETLKENSEKINEWINKSLQIVRKQPDGTWKLSYVIFNSNTPPTSE